MKEEPVSKVHQTKPKWYFNRSSLVTSFLLIGPLMLPLIWFHPQMSRTKKIFWTAVIVFATVVLTKFFIVTLKQFTKIYEDIKRF